MHLICTGTFYEYYSFICNSLSGDELFVPQLFLRNNSPPPALLFYTGCLSMFICVYLWLMFSILTLLIKQAAFHAHLSIIIDLSTPRGDPHA